MKDRAVVGDAPEFQEFEHGLRVDVAAEAACAQGSDGGGEGDLSVADGVDQRLDAETVADQREGLRGIVPDAEGEHAAEAGDESVDAPLLITAQEDFGVAMGAESVAAFFEFLAEFEEIIDAAVENQADFAVVGEHGLVAGGAEVDDGEAAVAEIGSGPVGGAFGIGSAMAEGVDHGADGGLVRGRVAGTD